VVIYDLFLIFLILRVATDKDELKAIPISVTEAKNVGIAFVFVGFRWFWFHAVSRTQIQ